MKTLATGADSAFKGGGAWLVCYLGIAVEGEDGGR